MDRHLRACAGSTRLRTSWMSSSAGSAAKRKADTSAETLHSGSAAASAGSGSASASSVPSSSAAGAAGSAASRPDAAKRSRTDGAAGSSEPTPELKKRSVRMSARVSGILRILAAIRALLSSFWPTSVTCFLILQFDARNQRFAQGTRCKLRCRSAAGQHVRRACMCGIAQARVVCCSALSLIAFPQF